MAAYGITARLNKLDTPRLSACAKVVPFTSFASRASTLSRVYHNRISVDLSPSYANGVRNDLNTSDTGSYSVTKSAIRSFITPFPPLL